MPSQHQVPYTRRSKRRCPSQPMLMVTHQPWLLPCSMPASAGQCLDTRHPVFCHTAPPRFKENHHKFFPAVPTLLPRRRCATASCPAPAICHQFTRFFWELYNPRFSSSPFSQSVPSSPWVAILSRSATVHLGPLAVLRIHKQEVDDDTTCPDICASRISVFPATCTTSASIQLPKNQANCISIVPSRHY